MALASVSHAPGSASRIWKYSTPPIGHTDLAARFFCNERSCTCFVEMAGDFAGPGRAWASWKRGVLQSGRELNLTFIWLNIPFANVARPL